MDMRKALEKAKSLLVENGIIHVVGLGKPSSFLDYIIEGLRVIPSFIISKCKEMHSCEDENIPVSYEYLRCIFDQAPYCQTEKDFEKLLPWNIKITEFHEEGTWKNDT